MMEHGGMEGQDAGMDPEEGSLAWDFNVSVIDIEGSIGSYGRGVSGGLVIRNVCNCEVRQSGKAEGWG